MTARFILGVDPGLSGAMAMLPLPDGVRTPLEPQVIDMPTRAIKVNRVKKRALDLQALATWFDLNRGDIKHAIIESVHAMPYFHKKSGTMRSQGGSANFNFGRAFGVIEAMVAASIIPIHYVTPQVWKRHYGLTFDKEASRQKASQLMPTHAHLWARSKDDGRAEAVLLALYGVNISIGC